jgi:hypothetical protein
MEPSDPGWDWYSLIQDAACDLDYIDIVQTSYLVPDSVFKKIRSGAIKKLKRARMACQSPESQAIIDEWLAEFDKEE